MDLSIVVPIYNEEANLALLVEQLLAAVRPLGRSFEIVLVDDGSRDGSPAALAALSQQVPELVAVLLRRNYGQTAAMAAGFDASSGAVIVTLDGDLQNDPADIPLLLERIGQGYDLVSGWRHQRQDAAVSRLLPSSLANRLIARVTGVHLHDYGCSLKAYRREVVDDLNLYGELHRFLPAPSLRAQQLRHRSHPAGADGPAHRLVHEAVSHPAHARVRPGRTGGDGCRAADGALAGGGEAAAGGRHRRSAPAAGGRAQPAGRGAAVLLRPAGRTADAHVPREPGQADLPGAGDVAGQRHRGELRAAGGR
jgi:hypothetical protein